MSILGQCNSKVIYGYPYLIVVFICCTVFSNLTAICIGYGRRGKVDLMVNISTAFSLILLLLPVRKRISMWAIILQIFNIISILTYIILDKVYLISKSAFEPRFRLIYGDIFFLILAFMSINFICSSIKYDK